MKHMAWFWRVRLFKVCSCSSSKCECGLPTYIFRCSHDFPQLFIITDSSRKAKINYFNISQGCFTRQKNILRLKWKHSVDYWVAIGRGITGLINTVLIKTVALIYSHILNAQFYTSIIIVEHKHKIFAI